MKIFRLRSYEMPVPGNYPYIDPSGRKFRAEPMAEAQAHNVEAFRKGNGRPRATYAECLEDVDRFNAKRLGNDPRFCVEVNADDPHQLGVSANAPGLEQCKGCGAPVPG
jgi:hypothetical protein